MIHSRHTFAALVVALAGAHAALARQVDPAFLAPGNDYLFTLDNGDILKARVVSLAADSLTIEHPVLGSVTLPLARVSSAAPGPSAAQVEAAADKVKKEAEAAAAVPPPIQEEAKLSFFQGWKSSVQAGINGADGNTENLSARIGFATARLTDEMESRFDLTYTYATSDGEKSASRGEANYRNDWLFKDSPWGFFVQGKAEYDEFQDWDWRLSAFAGPSYTVVKNETTTFRLRAGAGISREFGGSENHIVPEALAGFDFAHKFTDRQSIFINYEYLPSLDDFPAYRMITKAGYEIVVDPTNNISLKLGAEDFYDSSPGEGRKRNDIQYFALIAWAF